MVQWKRGSLLNGVTGAIQERFRKQRGEPLRGRKGKGMKRRRTHGVQQGLEGRRGQKLLCRTMGVKCRNRPCVINVGTFERLNVGTFNMPAHDFGQPQGVAPTMGLPDVVHRFKTMTTIILALLL
jgi:hypothetical protein